MEYEDGYHQPLNCDIVTHWDAYANGQGPRLSDFNDDNQK